MLSERDLVFKITIERKPNAILFFKIYSIEHKDFPVYPNIVRNY